MPGQTRMDDLQSQRTVLSERLQSFHRPQARSTEHGQAGIAQRRQHLRTIATPGPAGIFAKGDIALEMKVVFDPPVTPPQAH